MKQKKMQMQLLFWRKSSTRWKMTSLFQVSHNFIFLLMCREKRKRTLLTKSKRQGMKEVRPVKGVWACSQNGWLFRLLKRSLRGEGRDPRGGERRNEWKVLRLRIRIFKRKFFLSVSCVPIWICFRGSNHQIRHWSFLNYRLWVLQYSEKTFVESWTT